VLLVASIRLLQNKMRKFFTLNMGSPGNKGVNWLRIIVKAVHISFFTSGSRSVSRFPRNCETNTTSIQHHFTNSVNVTCKRIMQVVLDLICETNDMNNQL